MLRLLLLLFSILASLAAARADETGLPAEAVAAYRAGNYDEAVRSAEDSATAPALAFAARASIADAITRPEGFCIDCLKAARALAHRAMRLDPANVEAHLQEAIALGFLGRIMGVQTARREGLAEKVRAMLDRALALDPGNPWAEASLGAWHLEIVTQAGPLLASLLYGAGEQDGLTLYRGALRKAPDEPMLRYQFALALLARDTARHGTEARQALQHLQAAPAADALARFAAARAALLLQAMDAGDRTALLAMVRMFQGYGSASR